MYTYRIDVDALFVRTCKKNLNLFSCFRKFHKKCFGNGSSANVKKRKE